MVSYSRLINLTHTISHDIPTWTGSCGYHEKIVLDYDEGLRVQSLKIHAGLGTHLDAPAHFDPLGLSIGEIPIDNLVLSACVIDVHKESKEDYFVELDAIEKFEAIHGSLDGIGCVTFYTGWSKKWNSPDSYRSVRDDGSMHFPGISIDVAQHLYDRGVKVIGIDTLSPDGSNIEFPIHHLFLKNGHFLIENINNLDRCPPKGWTIGIFTPPFLGATEAPARLVAFCE